MKIYLKSNFVIPGVENDRVEFVGTAVTLRELLHTLSTLSPNRVEYIRPGAKALNPDDWEVEVNAVPYQNLRDGLEASLVDGDTVEIRIIPLGGG